MNPVNLDAQLARIAAVAPPNRVRIVQMARGFDWWTWLCERCAESWKTLGWQVRVAKEPPHALRCDGCGHCEAADEAKAA